MEKLIEKMKAELVNAENKMKNVKPTDYETKAYYHGTLETMRNCIHWAELERTIEKYR